jgi:hypothetical protein
MIAHAKGSPDTVDLAHTHLETKALSQSGLEGGTRRAGSLSTGSFEEGSSLSTQFRWMPSSPICQSKATSPLRRTASCQLWPASMALIKPIRASCRSFFSIVPTFSYVRRAGEHGFERIELWMGRNILGKSALSAHRLHDGPRCAIIAGFHVAPLEARFRYLRKDPACPAA